MSGRPLRRVAGIAVILALPGLVVLAILAAAGLLGLGPALIGGAAVLALTVLVAVPIGVSVGALNEAVAAGADDATAWRRRPAWLARWSGPAGALWRAFDRLARDARAQVERAEARAAAAEAVIAAVPDPLLLLDARRRIVRANLHSVAFVGPVVESPDLAASLRHPAVLAAADAVLGGERARVVEFTVTVPVERRLRARLARIEGPALDGAVAILTLHDVTALKRAEQMRADFIANASHELKTPLATMVGFIETLRGPARTDAKARERFLAIMHGEAHRMSRLVDDLLSLSRIELNEHVLPTGRVALGPVLQQVANVLELRAAGRQMAIVLAVPPDLPEVPGDRDELAQVFHNLIDNAIKYGNAGTSVTIAAAREGNARIAIAVRDAGDGIAGEHLTRLTERFYRVDTARSREMGGTGLGLAIVKHIVSRHRGRLGIDSTLGTGSVFTVSLPVGVEDAGEAPSPAASVIKAQ